MAKRPAKNGDYEVGYRKPPVHSRFPKGVSGNKSGRPKRKPTLADLIAQEGQKRVTYKEGGKEKSITKLEALVKKLFARASTGDHKAWTSIMDHLRSRAEETEHGSDVSQADREILARLLGFKDEEEPSAA